ncbi:cobalt ion binding protein [Perilla frutescens var. hirtella]|nr:cobalt ion binding protein [Perilla frutescens var. hirtella]
MATRFLARSLLTTKQSLSSVFSRSYAALASSSAVIPNSSSFLFRLRPLVAAASASYSRHLVPETSTRAFSTRQTASSLNDPNPNWSNRPPKETILLDGCDFEHWLVVVEKPEGDPTRDEIIDSYIKTLALIVGSEEEARMKIYSVSTRHYYAFGALVSEELSYKLKELPKVRWVLPDSYLDVKNKDYGGEPFINGQAVPYDPKYHEEWVRNNARANERNRRNDRPRNFDRSRNFERRREVQGQNSGPPGGNYGGPNSGGAGGNYGGPNPNSGGPGGNYGGPNSGGPGGNYGGPNSGGPGGNYGGPSSGGSYGGPPPNMGGQPNYGGGMPPPNSPGNYPANNVRPPPPPPVNNPSNFQQGPGPNSGGAPYQSGPGLPAGQNQSWGNAGYQNYPPGNAGYGPGPTQNNFAPNGQPSVNQNIPGRDFPPNY